MIIRARAPLRLGLAGGGTDLSPFADQYGGCVLNATVNLFSYAILSPNASGEVNFVAKDLRARWSGPATPSLPISADLPLHAGVYNRVVQDFNGGKPLSIDLVTHSDVLPGSGLGSSSTMVVALLKAFTEYLQLPLGEYEIARLAYEIERVDLRLAGGRQDQYAATFGGFNYLEFEADGHVVVNPLRVKRWIISELEASLVLFRTGSPRASAAVIENQVRNISSGDEKSLAATMALKQDAAEMKAAILRGNFCQFAEILGRSWENKKRTSGFVSNPLIEDVYETALASGALSGKVSGAGGGGFMMFVATPERRPDLIAALAKKGQVLTCVFSDHGTEGWRV